MFPPLRSTDLDDKKTYEIPRRPITAMRAQDVQILYVQRSSAGGEKVVYLTILIQRRTRINANFSLSTLKRGDYVDKKGEDAYIVE